VKTGETNDIAISGNIKPDSYEDDDLPFGLNNSNQTISISVTQERSFDTANDQDWTRITFSSGVREFDIRTTSNEQDVDTQLTLFDENGNIVGCALRRLFFAGRATRQWQCSYPGSKLQSHNHHLSKRFWSLN